MVGNRLLLGPQAAQTIKDIDREEQSEQQKRDRMLQMWLEMKGSDATYKVLSDVFEEVGNHQAAEVVKELVPPIAEGRSCHCILANDVKRE